VKRGLVTLSTKKIMDRKRGADLTKVPIKQRRFVEELLASDTFNLREAAIKAGYAKGAAGQTAQKLLEKPHIKAALGKAQRERSERCQLEADDVLNYLRAALFFNPLDYFYPSDDGHWNVLDPNSIPEEVGRLIESIEVSVTESKNGNTKSEFRVKLVSKSTALGLAMKHVGVEKHEVLHKLDWDELYEQQAVPTNVIDDANIIEVAAEEKSNE